jgi:hypothetical protein
MKTLAGAAVLLVALGAAPARAQDSVRITLERTSCFGTCPVYKVTMQDDGSVSYEGVQFVRVPGKRDWKIEPADVRALARDMEKAGFFEMQDVYTMPATDLPTTYTSLTIGARSKRIKNYLGAPPALREIEQRIDHVSGAKGYVTVSGAAIREMQQTGWRATGEDALGWMDHAVRNGDAEVVKALLAAGFDARAADANGVTLVMKAASSGDPDTVRAVLAGGGDPTARDRWGHNAADRARDAMTQPRREWPLVEATARPRDYALILKLLTDE